MGKPTQKSRRQHKLHTAKQSQNMQYGVAAEPGRGGGGRRPQPAHEPGPAEEPDADEGEEQVDAFFWLAVVLVRGLAPARMLWPPFLLVVTAIALSFSPQLSPGHVRRHGSASMRVKTGAAGQILRQSMHPVVTAWLVHSPGDDGYQCLRVGGGRAMNFSNNVLVTTLKAVNYFPDLASQASAQLWSTGRATTNPNGKHTLSTQIVHDYSPQYLLVNRRDRKSDIIK